MNVLISINCRYYFVGGPPGRHAGEHGRDLLHLFITTNVVPGRRRRPPTEAALLFRSVLPFEHRHLNLFRKTYQMAR